VSGPADELSRVVEELPADLGEAEQQGKPGRDQEHRGDNPGRQEEERYQQGDAGQGQDETRSWP